MSVEITQEADSPNALMKAIEITEAKLAIFHGRTLAREMVLPSSEGKWQPLEWQANASRMKLPAPRTEPLAVDFASLSEIRLRLRFSGVYRNGDRREYWVEHHLTPKLLKMEWEYRGFLGIV